MRARAWMWLSLAAALFGCSSSQGECSYDTDCTGVCERCNVDHQCYLDTTCTDKQEGRCNSDADCDPLQEHCVNQHCVPRGGDGYDGGDGDGSPADGDQIGPDLDYCLELNPDCTRPQSETATSQGRDLDHDDWGECCDCNDRDASINPGRTEIVYDCKDNDCNPATPDDDLDDDGYGSILRGCGPGSDCNDADKSIHPNAAELCDDKDNNCDGRVDIDPQTGKTVCTPPPCADVSGHYYVSANCPPWFTAQDEVDIVQDECNVYFTIDDSDGNPFVCTGTLDPNLNMNIYCSGVFGAVCTSRVNLGNEWIIDCGQGQTTCEFKMSRESSVTSCAHFSDTTCTNLGQNCGVVCVGGNGMVACVAVNPGGKQPGFYCNSSLGITCINDFCHENVCTSACRNDADCAAFSGTACRPIGYTGCVGGSLNINACIPSASGETSCRRTSECQPSSGRRCTVRQDQHDVATVCRSPQGSQSLGADCQANSECQSGLCMCGANPCSGGTGKCSEVCLGSSDCPSGAQCSQVDLLDLSGGSHTVSVCTWTSGGCSRDADCPVSTPLCSVNYNDEGTALITECVPANTRVDPPNPGGNCRSWVDCWSYWCADWQLPSYCLAVCASDADCLTFDSGTACPGGDDDCEIGYLCQSGACLRQFRCWAMVFSLPSVEGLDAVDLCQPVYRECETDRDCRAGEACKLGYNRDATEAQYFCEGEGPGTGELGAPCDSEGYAACRTSLCIIEGEGGPGKEYCSQACVVDADCTPDVDPTYDYRCAPITVWTPFGFDSAPACARR